MIVALVIAGILLFILMLGYVSSLAADVIDGTNNTPLPSDAMRYIVRRIRGSGSESG